MNESIIGFGIDALPSTISKKIQTQAKKIVPPEFNPDNLVSRAFGILQILNSPKDYPSKINDKFLLTEYLKLEIDFSIHQKPQLRSLRDSALGFIQNLEDILIHHPVHQPMPQRPQQVKLYTVNRLLKTPWSKFFAPILIRNIHNKTDQITKAHHYDLVTLNKKLYNFSIYPIKIIENLPLDALPTTWQDFDNLDIEGLIHKTISHYAAHKNLLDSTKNTITKNCAAGILGAGLGKSFYSRDVQLALPPLDDIDWDDTSPEELVPPPRKKKKDNPCLPERYFLGKDPLTTSLSYFHQSSLPLPILTRIENAVADHIGPNAPTLEAIYFLLFHLGKKPDFIIDLSNQELPLPTYHFRRKTIQHLPDEHIGWGKEINKLIPQIMAGDPSAAQQWANIQRTYEPTSLVYEHPVPNKLQVLFAEQRKQNNSLGLLWHEHGVMRPLEKEDFKTIYQIWEEHIFNIDGPTLNITEQNISQTFHALYSNAGLAPEELQILSGKSLQQYTLSYWYRAIDNQTLFANYAAAHQKINAQITAQAALENISILEITPSSQTIPSPTRNFGSRKRLSKSVAKKTIQSAVTNYLQSKESAFHARFNSLVILIVFCLFLFYGMRPQESYILKLSFLDLSNKTLTVDGKLHADREATRTFPLTHLMTVLFNQLLKYHRQIRSAKPEGLLFYLYNDAGVLEPLNTYTLKSIFHNLASLTKSKHLPELYGFRVLFYAYAIQSLSLKSRRMLMGHEQKGIESNNAYQDSYPVASHQDIEAFSQTIIQDLSLDFSGLPHAQN